MTDLLATGPAPGPDTDRPRRATAVWLVVVRVLAVLHALLALAQPVFIGQYLTGLPTWLGVHAAGATGVVLLGLLLVLSSTAYAISGGRWWLPPTYLLLLVAAIVQTSMGYARNLAVHVPLGVFVVIGAVGLAFAVFRPALRIPRARRGRLRPPAGGR